MSLYQCIRTSFWIYVAFCVFLFIFAESNVWEPRIIEEQKGDIIFLKKEPVLHWDRFGLYVKNIPGELADRMQYFRPY